MKSDEKMPPETHEASKPSAGTASSETVEKIAAAAKDLLYISETDAPFQPFFWPDDTDKLTFELVKKHAKLADDKKSETRSLAEFFEPIACEEDWMNAEEKAEVKRFQNLRKALEDNLRNIQVFRSGEINIDVFIIGQTAGGFAGVQTKVVET